MTRSVIVEDEAVAARRLRKMVEAEGLQVIEWLPSNQALQTYLNEQPAPDLFFMDIHLNDGIVFETLQTVEVNTPIIFTTAYDEFAIRAFKQKSIDYLLKPIGKSDLQGALAKFKSMYASQPNIDWQMLSQLVRSEQQSYRERIRVKVGDHLRSIPIADVQMVYSEQKITFLHTVDGRSYPIDQTVESLGEELDPGQFHRVNRGQIVQIDHIKDVIAYSNSRLMVKLSSPKHPEIIVARDRVKAFKDWLG
ncbi:MAG: LytTR family DNA-binding domain-containing protein [Bacteroidota bacterium]